MHPYETAKGTPLGTILTRWDRTCPPDERQWSRHCQALPATADKKAECSSHAFWGTSSVMGVLLQQYWARMLYI